MSNDYKACPFLCELRDFEIGMESQVIGYLCKAQCKDCPAHNNTVNKLTAEIERLKAVIAEIGAMTLTGADDVKDFIFMLCKDTVSDGEIKKAYREHLKKQIANMIDFGADTDAATKESEVEDE